jgi:hypothetical protein
MDVRGSKETLVLLADCCQVPNVIRGKKKCTFGDGRWSKGACLMLATISLWLK